MRASESNHVYPTSAEHDTEGLDCWCQPTYHLPCDECDGGCWKCSDGLIEITRADAEQLDEAIVIVHNDVRRGGWAMRSTYTFATLEVSAAAYLEIRAKLEEADYQHAIREDGAIDMHGIGLVRAPATPSVNERGTRYDLDELEAKARMAHDAERIPPTGWWYSRGRLADQYGLGKADAEYVAALRPDVLLAILERIRSCDRVVEAARNFARMGEGR